MLNKSNRNKKKQKLASCTLNTVKDNILTELSIDHFADKYHVTGRRDNPINLKILITVQYSQKSLGWDNSSLLSRSVVQQCIHIEG